MWSGVIERLNKDTGYRREFESVFGTLPTQDTVGRALATFLRTLLCGDSIHDRALKAQTTRQGKTLDVADYEKALPAGWVDDLGADRKGQKPAQLAAELHAGYQLFHNLNRDRPANCVLCHAGPLFTDGRFHNIGIGFSGRSDEPLGRIARVPVGRKDYLQMGAWKTPTLRSLSRTGPYFHDGYNDSLRSVITYHVTGGHWNSYLALELRDPNKPEDTRDLGLTVEEIRALELFLLALDGTAVDPIMRSWPRNLP